MKVFLLFLGICQGLAFVSSLRRATNPTAFAANVARASGTGLWISTESSSSSSSSSNAATSNYLGQYNDTLSFPPYHELMQLKQGECLVSEPFAVTTIDTETFRFCVKLYPRGGGHKASHVLGTKRQKSGFGMSYKVLPIFGAEEEKVGIYLQYLHKEGQGSVDASFGLRLMGRQVSGRRFDLEWRSGMRFVAEGEGKLAEGTANDFGAHLMQTILLSDFLGDDEPLSVQVSVILHERPLQVTTGNGENLEPKLPGSFGNLELVPRDIRGRKDSHDMEQVRVGRVVVPILQRLEQRPRLFELGAYPGVEYRILRIVDPETEQDLFYSRPGADYELKPIYPLVSQLERAWPVRVNEREIPSLLTPVMYNAVSAAGSLFTAITGLLAAFVISQAVSLFFIPSRSMDPTLQIGDVLLVDKVTPRLLHNHHVGHVVLFHPPDKLQDIVSRSGGKVTDRDLFVKRVAAEPGDSLTIEQSGAVKVNGKDTGGNRDLCAVEGSRLIQQYIQPTTTVIGKNEVGVLGDCSAVSIDSRVWGPLPTTDIVGRPLVRLWPLDRFGGIPDLPTTQTGWED